MFSFSKFYVVLSWWLSFWTLWSIFVLTYLLGIWSIVVFLLFAAVSFGL